MIGAATHLLRILALAWFGAWVIVGLVVESRPWRRWHR